MYEVICANGRPVYVTMKPDAMFEEYGYYYEVFADMSGDVLLDWGNTYDPNESYESALDYVCGIVERDVYHFAFV